MYVSMLTSWKVVAVTSHLNRPLVSRVVLTSVNELFLVLDICLRWIEVLDILLQRRLIQSWTVKWLLLTCT